MLVTIRQEVIDRPSGPVCRSGEDRIHLHLPRMEQTFLRSASPCDSNYNDM